MSNGARTMHGSTASSSPAFAPPFAPAFPIRTIDDIRRLEQTPLAEALTVQSTYEIFRNSANAFGDKTALTFLKTGNPADTPVRWSYAELLKGIHQSANMLHALGVYIVGFGTLQHQQGVFHFGRQPLQVVDRLQPLAK